MIGVDWNSIAAFLISLVVCGLMVRFGPRDAPDGKRKTQARAVSSGGGVGIAVGGYLALVAWWVWAGHSDWEYRGGGYFSPLVVGTLLVQAVPIGFLLVGLLDDMKPLSARLKLAMLVSLSVAFCVVVWRVDIGVRLNLPEPPWVYALIAGGALWVFVVVNATNFMDGSNGLALGSGVIMFWVLGALDMSSGALSSGALSAAILGFLVWNLAGRLYAGDAGALYVGSLIAGISLNGAAFGWYSIWIPPLIVLPFLTDIILTIIWRAGRGGNVMQAHREHAYQLFRRAGWGHLQVAALWWLFTAICGIAAIAVSRDSATIQFTTFAVCLAISIALWIIQRRIYWPLVSGPG